MFCVKTNCLCNFVFLLLSFFVFAIQFFIYYLLFCLCFKKFVFILCCFCPHLFLKLRPLFILGANWGPKNIFVGLTWGCNNTLTVANEHTGAYNKLANYEPGTLEAPLASEYAAQRPVYFYQRLNPSPTKAL